MSDLPLYHREPLLREVSTRVVRVGEEDGRPFAVLEEDLFYPEGGGQPADHGFLDEIAVVGVRKRNGETLNYLVEPVREGPVEARLDWERRFDHMQQHTGQHLLSALAEDRFGWATTAFHLGEAYSAIELDTPGIEQDALRRLEILANDAIREGRAVRPRLVAPDEYPALPVRSRGLPEGHKGPVRLIEIEGIDLNTCGGTHCASLAELQMIRLMGTEAMRGGTRMSFLVGGRLLREARRSAGRDLELKELLGCGPDEFARVLERRAAEAKAMRRRAESAERELAAALGASLATGEGGRAVHRAHGRDAVFLQALAGAFLEARPSGAAVLLAEDGDSTFFLVVAGEESDVDAAAVGAAVAEALGGRGGGRGGRYQGKGADLTLLARAEAAARDALGL